MLLAAMDDLLGTLGDRERKVLRLRFGLDEGRSRTLEEVGKEFNVTGERIRQIEAKALRKLRHPSQELRLHNLTILPESKQHPGLRGYVKLQAAIFEAKPEDFYQGYGLTCFLPQPKRTCPDCGQAIESTSKARYCPSCNTVPVACDACGRVVQRKRTLVMHAAKHGYKGQYCSQECIGHVLGKREKSSTYTWEGIPASLPY